jgi:hypothetical protein
LFFSRDFLLAWAATTSVRRKEPHARSLRTYALTQAGPTLAALQFSSVFLHACKSATCAAFSNFTPRTAGSVDEKQTVSELLRPLCLSTQHHTPCRISASQKRRLFQPLIHPTESSTVSRPVSLQFQLHCRSASLLGNHIHLRNCHPLHLDHFSIISHTISHCHGYASFRLLSLFSAFLIWALSCAIAVIPRFSDFGHNNNVCVEQQHRHRPSNNITATN